MIQALDIVIFIGNIAILVLGILALKNSYTSHTLINYNNRRIILFYVGLDLVGVFIIRSLFIFDIIDATQVSLVNGIMALACIGLILLEFGRRIK